MTFNELFDGFITMLFLPLQVIFAPIDALLNQIPGISSISAYLSQFASFISTIPEFIVNFFGINPLLWNGVLIVFVLYLLIIPTINVVKVLLTWLRG